MIWLRTPYLFDFVLLALFAAAAVRWLVEGNWPRAGYFVGALILNISVMLVK